MLVLKMCSLQSIRLSMLFAFFCLWVRFSLLIVSIGLHSGNEAELNELHEELNNKHKVELENLRRKHDDEIKVLQKRFSEDIRAERTKMEEEKQKDMDRLKEAMDGSVSEQQELQLRMLQEQHERELEAVRKELVRTHMEKFTEMTARLEKEHQVRYLCM